MQDNDSDEINEAAGVTKRVVDLRRRKAESAHLRGLVDDPDMVAVRIESQRRTITRGMWFFLTLGLAFTTAGVQDFLAGHREHSDPLWWAAWLAEPMLAGILIMLLMFEAEILSRGLTITDVWVGRLKKVLLSSTLVMNVWPAVAPWLTGNEPFDGGNLAIHIIVPVVVFGVAEVMPVIQHKFNEAITRAYRDAAHHTRNASPAPTAQPAVPTVEAPPSRPAVLATASRVKLPPQILDQVKAKATELANEGRELTADDVRQVVRVSPDMAAQIAAEVQQRNGHAFT
ncbi:hypothetical protein [Lentzea albida]|uniref:DUF2637 domain-containing protein n=1 Tax=Lentzea albida TaxID=65499 RepID=A0A1H9UBX7_9PSEU|nr:hypothetical protein [Lentzea albida]SES06664.1 hypothetical protein SAMN04488000_115152 [Lentzea albida]